MGRFVSEVNGARFEWGVVKIVNRESIQVYETRTHYLYTFHRYFAPKGSYSQYWKNFRLKALAGKTPRELYEYAEEKGVGHAVVYLRNAPEWAEEED